MGGYSNTDTWKIIYTGKHPISRARAYFVRGEIYLNPEKQDVNQRSCYYAPDQKKIGELQKEFPVDIMGRIIMYGLDRVMILKVQQVPLLFWKPLYRKGRKIVLQCVNPGYTQYRTQKLPQELFVITDQIKDNARREQERFELIPLAGQQTGFRELPSTP